VLPPTRTSSGFAAVTSKLTHRPVAGRDGALQPVGAHVHAAFLLRITDYGARCVELEQAIEGLVHLVP